VTPSGSHRQTPRASEVERLLGIAASRNATALYLTTHTLPHIRVDAEMRVLEGELPMSSADIETAVAELMPEGSRDAARRGEPTEWMAEFSGIGSVRCSTFRDHRGPGAIFQLISTRPMTAEQLGLSAEIQALATEAEGLVLVSSAQGHGKTSLVAALVDVINRQLPNYIITLETHVHLVHEHRNALISQRDLGGTAEQMLATARAALRERPDVLVIEDVSSAEMFQFALEAAGSGVLVIASVTAPSTTAALARAVEFFPQEDRRQIQALIAERLRGAVAQVLLRKAAGGRVAAREVLLATTSVTTLLSDGQLQDLPRAFDSGRKFGLISMTEALVGLLRNGTIDLREAYRKADDRQALLAALRRENVDTSAVERLA
jgi:twitching motility protein PilT